MNWIKEQRERKGVTQEQLASDLGFSRTLVTKWETGRATVTIENTRRLCEYFEIDINDVLSPGYVQTLIRKRRKSAKVGIAIESTMLICVIIMIILTIVKSATNKSFEWSEYMFIALSPFIAAFSGIDLHKDYLSIIDDRSLMISFLLSRTKGEEKKNIYSLSNAELRAKISAFKK